LSLLKIDEAFQSILSFALEIDSLI